MPEVRIGKDEAAQRLDRFLGKLLRGMPRGHIYKLLRTRKVRVNGRRAKADRILAEGDLVLIHMPREQFEKDARRKPGRAESLDFEIKFEDEHLLVVSKPPFLPVHPGAGHASNSLIDQVHAYLGIGDEARAFRPSLAHRLDRDTSGLVVIGKSANVVRELGSMFKRGKVEKSYLALARGVPRPRSGTWDFTVRRRDVRRARDDRSPDRGRKDARGKTAYRVSLVRDLAGPGGKKLRLCLLVIRLLTGKTHQIRSHLQQAGYPLAGDVRYGDKELNKLLRKEFGLKRQFLHAFRLALKHPVSGKRQVFKAAYPPDLDPLATALRLRIPKG